MTPIAIYTLGYHGQRDFNKTLGTLPLPQLVVDNARKLKGTPYDPFMGRYGNIGARAGFIVCSDVPIIAYGLSGFSIQRMIEEDFKKNPSAYNTSGSNKPGNPYFHRRARNQYAFFRNNDRLYPPSTIPHVGDLVFYRYKPNGYISHVALVTEVRGEKYFLMESAPETVFAQEVTGSLPIKRGSTLIGFGRMY